METEDNNIKRLSSIFFHPITGEKERVTVQCAVTDKQREGLKEWNIDVDVMVNNATNNELRSILEKKRYDALVEYCKENDRFKEVVISTELKGSEIISQILKSFMYDVEKMNNVNLCGSIGLMPNIIKVALGLLCRVSEIDNSDIDNGFDFSFSQCKLKRTDELTGEESTTNITLWVRPLLRYDDCTMLIIDKDDSKNCYLIEFKFDNVSDVMDKIQHPF